MKQRGCSIQWRGLCLEAVIFGFLSSPMAHAQPETRSFNIAAQSLPDALVTFALEANLSVAYPDIDFQGAVANPVDGRLLPAEALHRLLAGTGYKAVFLKSDTIRIYRTDLASKIQLPAMEEIVVTANKRVEMAQSVPASVSVIADDDVDKYGVQTANDLTMHVAGFSETNFGLGRDKISLRGIADSAFPGRSQSVVGLYLDETRLTGDAPDPGLRLVDIRRLEILRGPQGTLYGSGALGGIVRIITNKPELDRFQGMTSISAITTEGGRNSSGVDAMLNVPLVKNVLALRGVAYARTEGGYIDNVRLHANNINKTDIEGLRINLLWEPNDNWSVTTGITAQAIKADDSQYFESKLGFPQQANLVREPRRDRFLQTHLTIEGTLDWANITSASAHIGRRPENRYDASGAWKSLTGFAKGPSTFDDARDIQTTSNETRLTSVGDSRLNWTVGTFLSYREEDYRSQLAGPDHGRRRFVARTELRRDRAKEVAVFAETKYHFADNVALTTGGRLFFSDLNASTNIDRAFGNNSIERGDNHTTGFIPKMVLSFEPTDNALLYGGISEGFRLGGINIGSPFGASDSNGRGWPTSAFPIGRKFASDHFWNYELGLNSRLFNRRLSVNAAGFFIMWDNIQSDQVYKDGSFFTNNIGDAEVTGTDISLIFKATRHLRLESNIFWSLPKIKDPNPLYIRSMGRLPAAPEKSFGISGSYEFSLESDWDAFTSLEYEFVGKATFGFDSRNSPKMGNYSQVNMRLGISHGQWKGTFAVDNLINRHANTFAFGSPFDYSRNRPVTPLRPRSVELDLSCSY